MAVRMVVALLVMASVSFAGEVTRGDESVLLGTGTRDGGVAGAVAAIRRMDAAAGQYLVSVTTVQSTRSWEDLRRLGFSWQPGDGPFATLDPERGRVELRRIAGRTSSSSTATLRVGAGGTASFFVGGEVPVVTTTQIGGTVIQQSSTLSAGRRVVVRAVGPLGQDAVLLALSMESSEIVASGSGLPGTRGATAETEVALRLGEPAIVASLQSADGGTSRDGGTVMQVEGRGWSTRGPTWWRQGGSTGSGRRRGGGGGTLLMSVTVTRAQ